MNQPRLIVAVLLGLVVAACGDAAVDSADDPVPARGPETSEQAGESSDHEGAKTEALHLGYILPETGALAFLGPGTIGGVNVAVEEINEAGGVLGKPVQLSGGDEGNPDGITANLSADRLLQSQNVDAIIGTLSADIMLTIIDKITGSGTVECSPAGTAEVFTDYPDDGYHFLVTASDLLLGPVFANVMAGDGHTRIAYISRADDSGRQLVAATKAAVDEIGAENAAEVYYDPTARTFDAEVAEVARAEPDAIMIFAFDEGSVLLQRMTEAGIGPEAVGIYVHSGLRSDDLPEKVDSNNAGVLDGVKGLSPASTAQEDFLLRLDEEVDVELPTPLFSGESYDCTMIVALAAEQAGSTDSEAIREEMIAVTRDGEKCSNFADCRVLIQDGTDIDYEGVSGPLDFNEAGRPDVGTYDVFGWNAEGELSTLETIRTDQLPSN